jgi:heme oxygenase
LIARSSDPWNSGSGHQIVEIEESLTGHLALRAATQDHHAVVDGLFSRFDLADPGGYAGFLRAQADAFLPVERALDAARAETVLPDWPSRRRGALLIADLAALGEAGPDEGEALPLDDAAAILGAAYVLEGSRLGGKMLQRLVAEGQPMAFLTAPLPPGAWRAFLDGLDGRLGTADEQQVAIESARTVFARFRDAARRELGCTVDG